ncbi:BRD4-interacting chromatin-remodeling complex-associated protein-like [Chanos chanos]|uniref:BRD4-interacting chromatin-remodeling complex-associated protein-like n=1 Tax=Chanos chanos TaxID=29144 RepID=A0A6J2VEJ3_CHACN|nr:BRD4-interacting chromatin-remodeling complex-associated protein-like [Chanos chanos]
MLPSAGAALLHRPVQRWRGNPVDKALLFHDGVMDDEDDCRLLDFIGDVQAFDDYFHGSSNKSIEEDDVTNAACGSASNFFTSNTDDSSSGLKESHNHLGGFDEAGGAGLQLSNSLQFIEDELKGGASPGGVELGGEEQPFDILQKSLLEADITEQTLAQEALLDSQPPVAPTITTTTTFPQQLVSSGFTGVSGAGVVTPLSLAGAQPQAFLQQVPQLPNGPTGHIQVVGSFNSGTPSMMTINSLERPQIVLRPSGNAVTSASGQGAVFAPPTSGQVTMPFKSCGTPIPVQNIIIQRGAVPQALIRPIQPKPLQTAGHTVYNISNLGLQPNTASTTPAAANPAGAGYTANGSSQTAQQVKVVNPGSSIVVHSPLGQQGHSQPAQSSLPQGQFLLPNSLALATGTPVHGLQAVNGQVVQTSVAQGDTTSASTTTYSILANQNTAVQLIAGQNFAAAGGQLIVKQGVVGGSQIGQNSPTAVMQVSQRPGVAPKVWTGLHASSSPGPSPAQATPAQSRLAVVGSGAQGLTARQPVSVGPGQRLVLPVAQTGAASSQMGIQELQFEMQSAPLSQDPASAAQKGQLVSLLGTKAVKTPIPSNQEPSLTTNTQLNSQKRPAPQQLTRGGMVLQQLRKEHSAVLSPDRSPFTSLNDVMERLLPYHVFQGAPPGQDDFTKVDEEFEVVAANVLKRTQAMVNKYRRLLFSEAERLSLSSEMVMIDKTFNQEERSNLTQDKRMALVDPDGFLEDFCCAPKPMVPSPGAVDPSTQGSSLGGPASLPSYAGRHAERGVERRDGISEPAYRTETRPGCQDPGGGGGGQGVSLGGYENVTVNSILDIKRNQRSNVSSHQHNLHAPAGQSQHSSSQPYLSQPLGRGLEQPLPPEHGQTSLADTDSVLEAAVNSILEC